MQRDRLQSKRKQQLLRLEKEWQARKLQRGGSGRNSGCVRQQLR